MARTICLIAAVGRRGQIGLNDRLPWHDRDDLAFFKATTMGGIVIMGRRTAAALPSSLPGREIVVFDGREDPAALIARLPCDGRDVFVAGGTHTYRTFLPFVRRSIITHVDHDGPCDTLMPPLWGVYHEGQDG